MLMRSRGEYAEQNAGVNTKIVGMKEIACMTTSFSLHLQSTPFLWSDAGSASIGVMKMVNCSVQMGCYSRDAKYTTICLMGDILGGVQRKMISAPTENGKEGTD